MALCEISPPHDDIAELKDKVDFFVQTQTPPLQGVFYNGQLWGARVFVERLIGSAKRSLLLIDNWATVETLDLFVKKRTGVKVTIFTSEHYDEKGMPHHQVGSGRDSGHQEVGICFARERLMICLAGGSRSCATAWRAAVSAAQLGEKTDLFSQSPTGETGVLPVALGRYRPPCPPICGKLAASAEAREEGC